MFLVRCSCYLQAFHHATRLTPRTRPESRCQPLWLGMPSTTASEQETLCAVYSNETGELAIDQPLIRRSSFASRLLAEDVDATGPNAAAPATSTCGVTGATLLGDTGMGQSSRRGKKRGGDSHPDTALGVVDENYRNTKTQRSTLKVKTLNRSRSWLTAHSQLGLHKSCLGH